MEAIRNAGARLLDGTPRDPTRACRPSVAVGVAAGNLALASAWLWLHRPVLRWLLATFTRSDLRLHLGLLFVAVMLLGARALGASPLVRLRALLVRTPRLGAAPLALLLGGALAFHVVDARLDVDLLSSVCFGLGSYGLCGLYLAPRAWRRGLPAALLLIAILPFGEQADTYVGFSARVYTAKVVAHLLAALHVGAPPAPAVLLLDGSVAHVDAPCSGVRSLWAGALFFLGATVLERRALGPRWMLAGMGLALALVLANIARVTAIVLVALVVHRRDVAEAIHAPLGVLGFALACGCGLLLLRKANPWGDALDGGGAADPFLISPSPRPAHRLLAPALAAAALLLAALHTPRPLPRSSASAVTFTFPDGFAGDALPLTSAESDLFRRFGHTVADKRRIDWRGHHGTLLLVYSDSWRAHHPPELCLAGSGFRIGGVVPVELAPGETIRRVTLDGGAPGPGSGPGRTGLYWYQSPTRITGDLLERVWQGATGREPRWVEVSLLLDEPVFGPADGSLGGDAPEGRDLVRLVENIVSRALAEGSR